MTIQFTLFKLVIKKSMTNDKKAVWDSIVHLRNETIDGNETHIDLRDNLWANYSPDKRVRIRALLLSNGLISFKNEGSQWAFQLTADGILAKQRQFRRDGLVKYWYTQSFKGVRLIVLTALLTTTGTLAVELYKFRYLKQDRPQTKKERTIQQHNGLPTGIDSVNSTGK